MDINSLLVDDFEIIFNGQYIKRYGFGLVYTIGCHMDNYDMHGERSE